MVLISPWGIERPVPELTKLLEGFMSRYSVDDRGPGFQWLGDAVVLMFAVLGTIFACFAREIKSAFFPDGED